jgi:enterochelin esterase-like enzyme
MTRPVAVSMLLLSICLWLVASAQGQEAPLRPGVSLTREITPGTPHEYAVHAGAGDLIVCAITLTGITGAIEFRDASDQTIRTYAVSRESTSQQRLGIVAPQSATYRFRITATDATKGSYTVRLNTLPVSVRMRSDHAVSKDVHASPRIQRLAKDVRAGRRDAVAAFWAEVTHRGPLVEPAPENREDILVTFLWRETYATRNVFVSWAPRWIRPDDYYMSHLHGSDVWYKTVKIRQGSRFTYVLSPNDTAEDHQITRQTDPLNPRRYPEDVAPTDSVVASVFEAPGAPDESWAHRTPAQHGSIEQKILVSPLLKGLRDIWIYRPPGYLSGPSYPLIVLLDGKAYMNSTWMGAINTLDNLINDRRIQPAVVCFVDTSTARSTDLGFDRAFGDALATELMRMLRSSYGISQRPQDVVIGGYSSGGLAASLIALRHPNVFGNVLSQSGGFRQRVVGGPEPNAASSLVLAMGHVLVRFYLECGLYDNVPNADLPLDEMVLEETNLQGNRHFRDVLVGKGYDVTYRETGGAHEFLHWRAMLADGLMTLLPPR